MTTIPSRRRLIPTFFLIILGLLAGAVHAAVPADFQYGRITKTTGETFDLPYRFLVPPSFDESASYPLILFLHGNGGRGTDNEKQFFQNATGALQLVSDENLTRYPTFMLIPQATVQDGWKDYTFDQVVRAITELTSAYRIDSNRIYVTGFSAGGIATWRIIARFPFLFAAAVPLSGGGSQTTERLVNLPLWVFHAADDTVVLVPGSDNAVTGVRRAGGRVIYTRYAFGGHEISTTAYGNPYLLPWIMAQRRNRPVTGSPSLSITSPATEILPPPHSTTLTVAGVANFPEGGVTQVHWTTTTTVIGPGHDPAAYNLADGTSSWSVPSPIPSSTIFYAMATGPSWGNTTVGGGVTTVNDSFWKVPNKANLASPAITITAPTDSGELTVEEESLSLQGTATPAGSKSIKAITWSNDRGGQGSGVGTTSWNIEAIDLQPGRNVITVTVRDSSSITGTAQLIVNLVPPPSATATIDVDFGAATRTTAGAFNNLTNAASGAVINAITTDGQSTTISVAVTDGFQGINTAGIDSSDIFPTTARTDSFFVQADDNALGVITISNLGAAQRIDLGLLASRVTSADRTTAFTVAGVTQSINAGNNAGQMVWFNGVAPSNGTLRIEVRAGPTSPLGYLNALRLVLHAPTD